MRTRKAFSASRRSRLGSSLRQARSIHRRGGRPATVAKLDNTGVNGVYLTSEEKRRCRLGTRGRWCNLSGQLGASRITITILDHPANPGFPTYWHAAATVSSPRIRSAKNLSADGEQELNLSLARNQNVTFRYRILSRPNLNPKKPKRIQRLHIILSLTQRSGPGFALIP